MAGRAIRYSILYVKYPSWKDACKNSVNSYKKKPGSCKSPLHIPGLRPADVAIKENPKKAETWDDAMGTAATEFFGGDAQPLGFCMIEKALGKDVPRHQGSADKSLGLVSSRLMKHRKNEYRTTKRMHKAALK